MSAPLISTLPPAPSRADDGATFSTKADAFAAALPTFVTQANEQADFTDGRATAAAASAVLTAADRVQTGLDRTATAADRVQTGLDRTATGADRVQTGLDRVATGLDRSAVNAALAQVTDMTIAYSASFADANSRYDDFEDGQIVLILKDERYTPPRRTFNQVYKGVTLQSDFLANTYGSGGFIEFVDFDAPQFVNAPATSASAGFLGAVSVSGDNFFFHNGTAWRRVTGVTF